MSVLNNATPCALGCEGSKPNDHSHLKTASVGYHVLVCENMTFTGDFEPVHLKLGTTLKTVHATWHDVDWRYPPRCKRASISVCNADLRLHAFRAADWGFSDYGGQGRGRGMSRQAISMSSLPPAHPLWVRVYECDLRSSAGSWKQADHPELARGGAAYVDEIRSERDDRFEDTLNRQQS